MDAKLAIDRTPTAVASECAQGFKRFVFAGLGSVFFVLALIGVVVPGLPTTPFLLLATYFFARSFPGINRRLLRNQVFGPILRNWYQHRGVTRRTKQVAVLMVIAAIGLFLLSTSPAWPLLTLVVAGASIGLTVIWRLPVVEPV